MSELADRARPGDATALTELAATQERRLIKTLRRGDIVLFIVAAVISVDTIGVMASGGPRGCCGRYSWRRRSLCLPR